jgi:hypothetical protein
VTPEIAAQAAEYHRLESLIGGMLVAEDHDPRFSADDRLALDRAIARRAALDGEMRAAISLLSTREPAAWAAFVADGAARLRAIASSPADGERYAAGAALYPWEHDELPRGLALGLPLLAGRAG